MSRWFDNTWVLTWRVCGFFSKYKLDALPVRSFFRARNLSFKLKIFCYASSIAIHTSTNVWCIITDTQPRRENMTSYDCGFRMERDFCICVFFAFCALKFIRIEGFFYTRTIQSRESLLCIERIIFIIIIIFYYH